MNVNISIDDVSPHPMSSVKVLDQCFELIKIFPSIKFTLFVPIAYWRTVRPGIATPAPLRLDAFPEFCKTIKELPKENFEICYHGLFHGIPGQNDNDEFHHLSKEQAHEKFSTMFKVVEIAGLQDTFKPVFRPPAWRMSPHAIEAALEAGIRTLALSPKDYAKQTYCGAENSFPRVIYFDCAPPFEPLSAHPNTEIVYHACEWDKNYLSSTLRSELHDWLQQHPEAQFKFIEELL